MAAASLEGVIPMSTALAGCANCEKAAMEKPANSRIFLNCSKDDITKKTANGSNIS
jgi:hypothetical protein